MSSLDISSFFFAGQSLFTCDLYLLQHLRKFSHGSMKGTTTTHDGTVSMVNQITIAGFATVRLFQPLCLWNCYGTQPMKFLKNIWLLNINISSCPDCNMGLTTDCIAVHFTSESMAYLVLNVLEKRNCLPILDTLSKLFFHDGINH